MDFGEALRELKAHFCVCREGWNGKGMYIYLNDKDPAHEPFICMYTAQGKHQPGWLASQADMLAEDWNLVLESTGD